MFKRILLAAIILAGAWYVLYGSKIYEHNQQLAKAYVALLKPIRAHQAVEIIKQKGSAGNAVLLYVYKAKCMICKLYFPDVVKLAENYEGSMKVVTISVDENPVDLAAFLRGKNAPFEPFILDGARPDGLANELKAYLNLHFDGGVPYTVVIVSGEAPQEFSSGASFYDRIDKYLKSKKQ